MILAPLNGSHTRKSTQEASTDIQQEQLAELLGDGPLSPSIAEAQGMLYGFLCGGAVDPISIWLDQLLPPAQPTELRREAEEDLRQYAAPILEGLRGEDMLVQPFLPDETAPLVERATALYDWVRGFLYSMGVLKISEKDLSAEGSEVYRDFAALTHMDLDELEDSEDNEQAMMEVTEFVRVGALLIHEERSSRGREGDR